METLEIVKTIVSPAEKLIEAVSAAIGRVYEPHHIEKMAKAKAYEINELATTIRNNNDIPIMYDSNGVLIDARECEKIAQRASQRLLFQEITKQQNIESISNMAYDELVNASTVSEEQVNADWMFRFFNSVQDISDEMMQEICAHILANEIKVPNTYSYRTIEKLKNMTRKEVELFQKVAGLSLRYANTYFLINDNSILNNHGVYFANLLNLEECGMISAQSITLTIEVSGDRDAYLTNNEIIGIISGKELTGKEELVLNIFSFTESGKQLIDSMQHQTDAQYLIDCLINIRNNNKKLRITAHNINYIDDEGNINYNTNDTLPALSEL